VFGGVARQNFPGNRRRHAGAVAQQAVIGQRLFVGKGREPFAECRDELGRFRLQIR
jgi:hypothetical protein